MNHYLTPKGIGRDWWELPVGIYGTVMTIAGLYGCVKTPIESGRVLVTLLAYLLLMGFVSFPLWLLMLRWKRRRLAQSIARNMARQKGDSISLDALDRKLGIPGSADEIRRLIGLGYLEHLDIDQRNQCVWIASRGAAASAETQSILSQIHALNVAIDDETISRQIARIETATEGISHVLQRDPERAGDVRRLMNYYLPTTIRLLQTYDMMEDQNYQGENIRASRLRIEAILEKVADAVERQQDKLFHSDALDVEAEITVMEAMMKAEVST